MRGLAAIVTLLWLAPCAAWAQADAGVPAQPPAAGTPSLAPDSVVSSTGGADSIGPIDQTAVAIHDAEEWLSDGLRRDAIVHGVVSPYYSEMGRSMRSSFHPDLVAIEGERRRGMSIPEIALDELSRYGPPEAPRGPASVYTPEMSAAHPEDPSEVQAQQQFEIQSMLNAHTRWQRVEVHILQDRTGHVLRATVTHSSESHTLDGAAMAAVTEAATARPPPPPAVMGERQTIDSDWSFWCGEVVPYAGQAGCIEGPDGQGLQCTALGRPLLRTRVVLLDVHDAEHDRVERPRRHRVRAHPVETPVPPPHDGPVRDAVPDMPTHAYAPPGAP